MTTLTPTPIKPFSLATISKRLLIYVSVFLLIYTGINQLRKPIVPVNSSLSFTNMDGKPLDIAKISQDKAVLVYFWGTWCGVCRQTTPLVNSLNTDSYPVVSVAVQSDDDNELANYIRQHRLNFSVINDGEGKLFNAWQGQVTPSYAIVSQGQVVQAFTGIQPAWVLKLRMQWVNWLA